MSRHVDESASCSRSIGRLVLVSVLLALLAGGCFRERRRPPAPPEIQGETVRKNIIDATQAPEYSWLAAQCLETTTWIYGAESNDLLPNEQNPGSKSSMMGLYRGVLRAAELGGGTPSHPSEYFYGLKIDSFQEPTTDPFAGRLVLLMPPGTQFEVSTIYIEDEWHAAPFLYPIADLVDDREQPFRAYVGRLLTLDATRVLDAHTYGDRVRAGESPFDEDVLRFCDAPSSAEASATEP